VFDDRLTAPQLPLYAYALGVESIDAIDAIAFAQVSDDYQRYLGVGTNASGFEAAKRGNSNVPPWEEIRTSWASKLETLVNELIEGEAALAPAYGKKTCDTCSFERFCRIDLQALQTVDDASDNEEATDS
jgi:hypothetical protein